MNKYINLIYMILIVSQCIILMRAPIACEGVAIGKKDPSLPSSKIVSEQQHRKQYNVNTVLPKSSQLVSSNRRQKENKSTTAIKLSPRDAAISMNSIDFLKELVRKKDTFDEKYYALMDDDYYHRHNHDVNFNSNDNKKVEQQQQKQQSKEIMTASVVEYTGRLWFMKKRNQNNGNGGIQFQESVRIHQISECGTSSTIECITKYKNRNTDEWVDCSKVVCTFRHNDDGIGNDDGETNETGLIMNIGSEILIRFPLLGAGGAVRRQISDTFEVATKAFFRQRGMHH